MNQVLFIVWGVYLACGVSLGVLTYWIVTDYTPTQVEREVDIHKYPRPNYEMYWTPEPLPDPHDFKVKKDQVA